MYAYVNTNQPIGISAINLVNALAISSNGTISENQTITSGGKAIAQNLAGANCIAISTNEEYLFISNVGGSDIASFSINSDGTLTFIGITFVQCASLICSLNGSYLFATSIFASQISTLSINSNGTLSSVSGSPFHIPTGGTPIALGITTDGNFLIVSCQNSNQLLSLSIAASGLLTSVSTINVGIFPYALCISGDNSYIFLAVGTAILTYSLNNGVISALPISTLITTNVQYVVISSNSKYLFATDTTLNAVSSYSINAGILTFINGVNVGSSATLLQLNQSNNFLYVILFDDDSTDWFIWSLDVATNGTLSTNFSDEVEVSSVSPIGLIANPPSITIIPIPCFLEGTKILCFSNEKEVYLPIESLRNGDLVKTLNNGYLPINKVGTSTIRNLNSDDRIIDRLYKLNQKDYPELEEDLIITGGHSVLVDHLTDIQRDKIGEIFVTDGKYRLMAYLDERAEIHKGKGTFNVWHVVIGDNENINYGIYANGLLVESCFEKYMIDNMNVV